ncbi:U5 small nuclear ribonucleoprotein component [Achlya hypogyna]|uniref:U5 small nuclear ribonucleoprotein component n=1 Tax=Achlya hypogyna TaxID=1202772 RepID=A0A1V9ZJI1_ACHHY|nr:U5 small nuclear ribonucleoprotein component [Achlya hypogyna]
MSESLYDEFGNYIGPELDDSSSESEEERQESDREEEASDDEDERREVDDDGDDNMGREPGSALSTYREEDHRIVLHEDKQYYPDAEEVYGDAEVLVMEEDAQAIETPLVAPVKVKEFSSAEKPPKTAYSNEFLASLMDHPAMVRNVAVVGDLHAGKTVLLDLLVEATHEVKWKDQQTDTTKKAMAVDLERRYTDTRMDEQARKVSIKSTPVSLVLPASNGKSFIMNIIDCPGHVNFSDETTAAMQVADGVVLVVDAIEGVMMNTETIVKTALLSKLPILLVVNKVDRLIIELKLPPTDAYFKLLHTIEEVNKIIETHTPLGQTMKRVSPELGNTCFASAQHGWHFSLESFAHLYSQAHRGVNAVELAKRLWGDIYYAPATRTFKKKVPYENAQRTFVSFILEPIYKIYSQVLGEDTATLSKTLRSLGLRVRREDLHLNPRPLLKLVLSQFLGRSASSFVDMVTRHVPSPLETAAAKVQALYTGAPDSKVAAAMRACDPTGPLMINIVKLYSSTDGATFSAFGRVYSGAVTTDQRVKVLGDSYSVDDDEDMCVRTVEAVAISQGRYSVRVNRIVAGNWVLLEGVDSSIINSATITDASEEVLESERVGIFTPLAQRFGTSAVVKLAVEPLNPSELPKMLEGLRKVSKSYPLVTTKVEESGEHVILCTGELAADCILHDLRKMYSEIEIKVADPVTSFCETVIETSSVQCFAETPNQKNKLTMIAEPLDVGLAKDIETGVVSLNWPKKDVAEFFQNQYKWDVLAARSVWAFGPDTTGPNVLIDDTLSSEVDKKALNSVKSSIVQGFQWGCREGPLCDEPIRASKFKILHASLASEPIHRAGGQLIPTARRVVYSSFLTATPRLLEPMYALEIQCPADTVSTLYQVLSRRRGHITQDTPKAGSPMYTVRGFLPVIESFGFETDLRVFTQGHAFCTQTFDHWALVPGDPLDANIILRPLEPSPVDALAREFMVKTRRRKGLSEEVNVAKFFDDPMLQELAKHDMDADHVM